MSYMKTLMIDRMNGNFIPYDKDGQPMDYYQCDCQIKDVMDDCDKRCNVSIDWIEAVERLKQIRNN